VAVKERRDDKGFKRPGLTIAYRLQLQLGGQIQIPTRGGSGAVTPVKIAPKGARSHQSGGLFTY